MIKTVSMLTVHPFPQQLFAIVLFLVLTAAANADAQQSERGVRLVQNESARRVDVFIDGQPFTSYIWPETLKKPVLYPLRTARGTVVTRGFPLDPRAGERVDHPHHAGLWFNYGDVNGVDFWNNSTALAPEEQRKMGTIAHRRITRATDGKDSGELAIEADWLMPNGQPVLQEATSFIFQGAPNLRSVDRITRLTALDKRVVFHDNKEGVLGMRVRRELEQPSNEPLIFTDASGRPTAVKMMNNQGVSGLYRSSEGKTGDAVWGTRARWTMLTGRVDQESVTLVMFDHPKNPGFPTYWHARGYGLFAANPLGQEVFSNGKEKLSFTLEPNESVTFRHRLLIVSAALTSDQVETQYRSFIDSVK